MRFFLNLVFQNLPAGHFVHDVEELAGEYVPAGQGKHFANTRDNVDNMLEPSEYVPAGQGLHLLDFGKEYVPGLIRNAKT